MATLRALVLVCSLKKSPAPSSSERLGREVLTALADHDVDGEVVRVVDHDVRFGVSTDEGDAELSETDDQGRMLTYGKVATVAVVGNEDGAHHVTAEVMQALNDVGFTVPASGGTYWVGEAMQGKDYVDAGAKPDTTGKATKTLAANAAHAARLLADAPYPPA
jgi:hypothetical protein